MPTYIIVINKCVTPIFATRKVRLATSKLPGSGYNRVVYKSRDFITIYIIIILLFTVTIALSYISTLNIIYIYLILIIIALISEELTILYTLFTCL